MSSESKISRDERLRDWVAKQYWGYGPLSQAARDYGARFRWLAAEARADAAGMQRAIDEWLESRDNNEARHRSADFLRQDWAPRIGGARKSLEDAARDGIDASPAEMAEALELFAERDLDKRLAKTLTTLEEPFWNYATSLAWLVFRGEAAETEPHLRRSLSKSETTGALSDDLIFKFGAAWHLDCFFSVCAEKCEGAVQTFEMALKANSVAAEGCFSKGDGRLEPIPSVEWTRLRPDELLPSHPIFRTAKNKDAPYWSDVRFSAEDVRAIVSPQAPKTPSVTRRRPGRPEKYPEKACRKAAIDYKTRASRGEKVTKKEFGIPIAKFNQHLDQIESEIESLGLDELSALQRMEADLEREAQSEP